MRKKWTLIDLFFMYLSMFLITCIVIFIYLSVKYDMEKVDTVFNEPYLGELNTDLPPIDVVDVPEMIFVDVVKTKTVVKTINKTTNHIPVLLRYKVNCDGKGDCYPMEYKNGKWYRY